ncbi:MAG TPA: F0F1 ATP synthase subunit delta [Propionibacteriaceae bacterium]
MSTASDTRLSALDKIVDGSDTSGSFASDLFSVVDLLDSSAMLRRAITDPGTPEEARAGLVHGLLDGKVAGPVAALVADAAKLRWGGGRTFAAALERQAVRAELISANGEGTLEETEDELFRFARVVESNPGLRNALGDRSVGLSERQDLVGELLAGRSTKATLTLAKRAVAARERTFAHTIEGFVTLAAAQKNRLVATVRVAQPLSGEQRDRLQASLSKQAGRQVALQEIVDPDVLGGIRVELGDEVVEGTVAGRLEAARRLFG